VVMSLIFIVLNIVQISLIYSYNNYYWTVLFPGLLLIVFIAILCYQWRLYRVGRRFQRSACEKIGIAATCILNILAVEFGYLKGVAVPAAHEKVWHTTIDSHQSLPPFAMALTQGDHFEKRAMLANDTNQLDELWRNQTAAIPANQRAFTDYISYAPPDIPGVVSAGQSHSVFFNGSYPTELAATDNLNLAFLYYVNSDFEEAGSLGFAVFDPKFLAKDLFETALKYGIIVGNLFSAYR